MATEYTIYYLGAPEDLRAAMDETLPPDCFPHLSISPTRAFDREILAEEGFPSDFPLQLHLRLDKFRRSEAMPALYRLRDRLGPDKSLFLFQNETELPPPR